MINTLLFVAGINTLYCRHGSALGFLWSLEDPMLFSIPTITISLSTNNSTNVIFLTLRQVKFSSLPHFVNAILKFYARVCFLENMQGNA
jgi:hypothetical protein